MNTVNHTKIACIILLAVIISVVTWLTLRGDIAYIYALHLENNWIKADPKTKNELEQYLHLYSLHKIEPNQSMWGNKYNLKTGERMMQYRILWHKKCPLDVVYDSKNNIKKIYTSYE